MNLLFAGPMWRDEAATLNLSTFSWDAAWASLQHENFPLAWLVVLRGWRWVGLGGSDFSLRVLGFAIGVAVLIAIWRTARTLGIRWPIVSLLLLGFSPVLLRVGDSMRAYGLGVLCVLIVLGAVRRVLDRVSAPRILLLGALALLSVHTVVYSVVILCAILAGGAVVALRRERTGTAIALAGIGVIAVSSLSIYLPSFAGAQPWVTTIRSDVHVGLIVRRLIRTWREGGTAVAALWAVALPWTLARSARALRSDLGLFTFVTSVAAITGYLAFLRVLDYSPQLWYYLPLVALLAPLVDATIDAVVRTGLPARRRRLVTVGAILILATIMSLHAALTRQSTVDLVATEIHARASADDLVVVHPWWLGISFGRYFRGPAAWTTVPEIEDHSVHRYDLLRERLRSPDPIGPLLARIEGALVSGHRVWLATTVERSWWEHTATREDPFRSRSRSYAEDARAAWRFSTEIGALLDRLSARVRPVPLATPFPVNQNEAILLYEISR